MATYDEWKAHDTTGEAEESPACEGERDCDGTPEEEVSVAALSGDEGAPDALKMCARCAKWTREYWRREAAAERI